jgi:hypothetical protein
MTKARDLANGGFGLVLVKPSSVVGGTDNGKGTVNFSAVSGVSLNNVFTSTYRHYRISLQLTAATADADIRIRMRFNGSDTSSNYYFGGAYGIFTGSNSVWAGNNVDRWALGSIDTSNANIAQSYTMDIFSPQINRSTNISLQGWGQETGGNTYWISFSGVQNDSTQFDGFSVLATAGAVSGIVSVYGYNN